MSELVAWRSMVDLRTRGTQSDASKLLRKRSGVERAARIQLDKWESQYYLNKLAAVLMGVKTALKAQHSSHALADSRCPSASWMSTSGALASIVSSHTLVRCDDTKAGRLQQIFETTWRGFP